MQSKLATLAQTSPPPYYLHKPLCDLTGTSWTPEELWGLFPHLNQPEQKYLNAGWVDWISGKVGRDGQSLAQAVQGTGGVSIPGNVQGMFICGAQGRVSGGIGRAELTAGLQDLIGLFHL